MQIKSPLLPSDPMQVVSRPWELGRLRKMAAPAPSPKRTQVLRSFQLTMEESFSAPMTRTVSTVWAMMKCWPISSAKMKPGTGGFDVEGGGAAGADFRWTTQAVEGKGMSGVMVARTIKINLVGGDVGALHGGEGGFGGEVGGVLVLGGDAALLDAGAAGDPFVGGVHHFFQVGVGEDAVGDVGADGGDGAGAAFEMVAGAGVDEFFGRRRHVLASARRAAAWAASAGSCR